MAMVETVTDKPPTDAQAVEVAPQAHKVEPVDLSTAKGRLIRRQIAKNQDGLIFDPHPPGWERMRPPSEYEQLKGLNVTERTLVTERDAVGAKSATITLWEKKADPGKEHYIIFTSKRGDIADTGPMKNGMSVEGYERHAGLDFLRTLAADGAGFTVVTLRGYGNNKGKPGEAGFQRDIDVFMQDWLSNARREGSVKKVIDPHPNLKTHKIARYEDSNGMPHANRTVVLGISLGTGNAEYLAEKLTERGHPPALLMMVNPYKRMSEIGSYVLKNLPRVDGKKFKTGFDYPPTSLELSLKHQFKIDEGLPRLSKVTQVLVVTSGNDSVIPKSNSAELVKIAKQAGLVVHQKIFGVYDHYNIPPDALARTARVGYMVAQQHNRKSKKANYTTISERLPLLRDGVFSPSSSTDPATPAVKALLDRALKMKDRMGLTHHLPQTHELAEVLPVEWLTGGAKKELVLASDKIPWVRRPTASEESSRIVFSTSGGIENNLAGVKHYNIGPLSARYTGLLRNSDAMDRS